ncbi:MAG: hypothetical protein ACKOOF_13580 [Planctomycetaceae bacterium]|jgi:hypothetical protein
MSLAGETPRHGPRIEVQFDRADRHYEAGEDLRVRYEVGGLEGDALRAVEHSVLWYTEGKGEEDLCVHFFERATKPDVTGSFAMTLPRSPLSYEGVIVKIRWCVRVRIFFHGGRDFVSEHVFDVGRVPPARMPQAAKP